MYKSAVFVYCNCFLLLLINNVFHLCGGRLLFNKGTLRLRQRKHIARVVLCFVCTTGTKSDNAD